MFSYSFVLLLISSYLSSSDTLKHFAIYLLLSKNTKAGILSGFCVLSDMNDL